MAECKKCLYFYICKMYADDVRGDYEDSCLFEDCSNFKNKADFVEVVRCKDCFYFKDFGECNLSGIECMADDFCSYGTPKERGADKPKITCLNCKHLMFSDMYGECNKQLRIVNPSDTCAYAEPKERGGEK